MRHWSIRVIVSVMLMLPTTAEAHATRRDGAVTRNYLTDYERFLGAVSRNAARGHAAELALIAHVKERCAGALEGAPPGQELSTLSEDVYASLALAAYAPVAPVGISFYDEVHGLRWVRLSVTRAARRYVGEVKAYSSLRSPDVCSSALAYRGTDFRAVPSNAHQFVAKFAVLEAEPDEVDPELLRPYERGEGRLLARIRHLESTIEQAEAATVVNWRVVLGLLGVSGGQGASDDPLTG
jgi:hypothetical protein